MEDAGKWTMLRIIRGKALGRTSALMSRTVSRSSPGKSLPDNTTPRWVNLRGESSVRMLLSPTVATDTTIASSTSEAYPCQWT